MHRIKQYFRTTFRLLLFGLLSSWLAVLRLIRHILKQKGKEAKTQEIKSASIADGGVAPVLSPTIEPETKAIEEQVKAEIIKPASIADSGVAPVLSPTIEPETKAIEEQVKAEIIKPASIADSGVAPALSPTVEPEAKTIEEQMKAEDSTLALQATEAYCVKCRQKRVIQEARKVTTQKGRRAVEGTCPVCGTKLFRFIAREKEKLSEEGGD